MEALYKKVVQVILECKDVIALTGAGVSAERGVKIIIYDNGL